jgi:hypothetical protein
MRHWNSAGIETVQASGFFTEYFLFSLLHAENVACLLCDVQYYVRHVHG